MFAGNEVNGSLQFQLFWAVGSSRLKEQEKEKAEMLELLSRVGQALGHSPTSFLEVGFLFYNRRDRGSELSTGIRNETPLRSMLTPLSITPCTLWVPSGRR